MKLEIKTSRSQAVPRGVKKELAKNETWSRLIKLTTGVGDWLEMVSRCASIARRGRV